MISNYIEFYNNRKLAENIARQSVDKTDVDIHDIYDYFGGCSGWSSDVVLFAKDLELSIEKRILRIRPDISQALRRAHAGGKRTVVVSDTYMPKEFFDSVLENLGLSDVVDELYASAITGKRKDRGDVWAWLFQRENKNEFVHVGDNEETDIHHPIVEGVSVVPVINTTVLADLRGINCNKEWSMITPHWSDGVIVGPAISVIGRNAFSSNGKFLPFEIDSLNEFGYTIYGPIVFGFLTWLSSTAIDNSVEKIAFFAREGYFLLKWYNLIRNLMGDLGDQYPNAQFFPISRRLAIGALQSKGIDLKSILGGAPFKGKFDDFLNARIGYNVNPESVYCDIDVETVSDSGKKYLENLINNLSEDIIESSGGYAERLQLYLEQSGLNCSRLGVVDIGCSGTIQMALSRLNPDTKMTGLYMVTSAEASRLRDLGGDAFGYFSQENSNPDSVVKNYSLLLEALLTAPHGQVIDYRKAFNGEMIPICGEKGKSQIEFSNLIQIGHGVERFIKDLLDVYGPDIGLAQFSAAACEIPLRAATVEGKIKISPHILKMLHLEDNFCGNRETKVAEVYRLV